VFSRVSLTNLINLGGILFWVKESIILFLLIESKINASSWFYYKKVQYSV